MNKKDEDMYYEIDKESYRASVMRASSKTICETNYWNGYNDAIKTLLNIMWKYK